MKFTTITALGWLFASTMAMAAPVQQAAAPVVTQKELDFVQILIKGGMMMAPLALLSILAVLLILVYFLTIRRNAVVSDRFMDTAEELIRKRDFSGLLAFCERRNECMARVTHKSLAFLTHYPNAPFSGVREVAEAEGSRQAGLLSSRITYLADVGSIAPMVGLLGTVLGMIKSFLEISSGEIQGVRQMGLAAGVSEALITTAAGLMIGIPAMVFYSFFRGRVQKYIAELEAAATHLMALLHTQMEAKPKKAADAEDESAGPLRQRRRDLRGV
jgi:biopolymer transport protein ExbB